MNPLLACVSSSCSVINSLKGCLQMTTAMRYPAACTSHVQPLHIPGPRGHATASCCRLLQPKRTLSWQQLPPPLHSTARKAPKAAPQQAPPPWQRLSQPSCQPRLSSRVHPCRPVSRVSMPLIPGPGPAASRCTAETGTQTRPALTATCMGTPSSQEPCITTAQAAST